MSLRNKDAFWDEWKDVVKRDFNHPCIMAWVPFNERSSACENEEEQRALVEIYRKTKEMDPTRLVVDNSGYVHTETDIVDIHDYTGWKGGYTLTCGRNITRRGENRPLRTGPSWLRASSIGDSPLS